MIEGATKFTILFRHRDEAQLYRGTLPEFRGMVISDLAPARDIPNYHGQRHRVGFYASTKAGGHLPFESGLERLRLQFLDFDREVVTFLTQPFTLEWVEGKRTYRYTPDLLAIHASGKRVVEDVKPARFHDSAKNRRAFDAAREALPSIGFSFELWAPPEPTIVRNVQYLAGYRRVPAGLREYMRPILAALREGPRTLAALADGTGPALFTRPVIYHLIWNHRIELDLSCPLSHGTLLRWKGAGS
ncbi:TnsA-like heteromeric transposase endonuclease subunit [Deinococcus wulumuqiensis]